MTAASRPPWGLLAALSLLNLLLLATTFNALGQVLPSMIAELGFSWAQAGLGFSLLGVSCGLSSLLPAASIRRVGVSATFLMGGILLAAGFALLATARGLLAYQTGTVLLGIGFCFCGAVPAVHVISGHFTRRSSALGAYFTLGGLGAVVGPVSFYLVHTSLGGWRIYWWLCAGAALALGGLAAFVTRERAAAAPAGEPETGPRPDPTGWPFRLAIGTWQFWGVVAAYTGCLLVNTTVHGLAFQQLLDHGAGEAGATFWISAAATVSAIGAAAAGWLGERIDGRRLTILSLAALALTGASLSVAEGWPWLILFAISMGVGLGFSYVGTALFLQQYFGRAANLELYSVMTVVSTAAAVGPVLGGVAHDRIGSFSPVFAGLAVVDLALLLMVAAMRRPAPRLRLTI